MLMAVSGGLAARSSRAKGRVLRVASWPQKADASAVIEFISSSVNESADMEPRLRQTGGALHAIPLSPHSG